MHTAYVAVTITTTALTAGIAIADFIPAGFVLANSAAVGVPPRGLPILGLLKAAGAAGLLIASPPSLRSASRPRSVSSSSSPARSPRTSAPTSYYPGAYWLLGIAALLLAALDR